MNDYDVIIIGGGMAGLSCAYRLKQSNKKILVLEARDRVGGRVLNGPIDTTTDIELGGEFFGPGQDRAYALTKELNLETFVNYSKGNHLFEPSAGAITTYKGTIPKLKPRVLFDIVKAQLRFELMVRTINLECPWMSRRADLYDSQTLEDWINKNMHTKMGHELFTLACEAIWSCSPRDLSLLHALTYARGGSSLNKVMSSAQSDRVVGGTQLLALEIARRLKDDMRYSAPVTEVRQNKDGVVVLQGEHEYMAKHVVVATPLTLMNKITYLPALPNEYIKLLEHAKMGKVIKVMAVYKRPFWREQGLSGMATTLKGPMSAVFDNTPYNGKYGVLLGFIEAGHSVQYASLQKEDRKKTVVDAFTRLFGIEASHPIDYIEVNWNEERFTGGGYSASLTPGGWTKYGKFLREPYGRIHWAGTERAAKWYGYIDGAIRSGEDTAAAINNSL